MGLFIATRFRKHLLWTSALCGIQIHAQLPSSQSEAWHLLKDGYHMTSVRLWWWKGAQLPTLGS